MDGAGLSVPFFRDPRSLAVTAAILALVVSYPWGAGTPGRDRFARSCRPVRGDYAAA